MNGVKECFTILLLLFGFCLSGPAFATDVDNEFAPDAEEAEESEEHIVTLTNDDFKFGSYIIDKPGTYILGEDIVFNPNSVETLNSLPQVTKDILSSQGGVSFPVDAYQAGVPLPTQYAHGAPATCMPCGPTDRRYDPRNFGLGFFAAIVVAADDVEIDLNEHSIKQSEAHALLQRFFALFELAEAPFIPKQGPANFGDSIISANRVTIHNGVIGRSAHHGIHGNGNRGIRIRDIDFEDYEVAAVALNGVRNLRVRNVRAQNRKDVPVIGTFSSLQFIKAYVNELVRNGSSTTLTVNGVPYSASDIQADLRNAINNVYFDIVTSGRDFIDPLAHPDEYALFHNKFGVVDGNSYSFLVNNLGVAVNGFPVRPASFKDAVEVIKDRTWSSNINFSDVHILSQHAFINEIVALNQGGKPVIDPVGSVFQIRNLHPNTSAPITMTSLDAASARYIGNVAANAQAFVAKAHLAGDFAASHLDLTRNNITQAVLDWVEAAPGSETLSSIVRSGSDYFCNGDSMFHVNKGVIGFKLDAAFDISVVQTSVNDLKNFGAQGSSACGDYLNGKSHPLATYSGYGGAVTRGYTFAGSGKVFMKNNTVTNIGAAEGDAIGVDLFDSWKPRVVVTDVSNMNAGGTTTPGDYVAPNTVPDATGFKAGDKVRRAQVRRSCVEHLDATGSVSFAEGDIKVRKPRCTP